MKKYFLLSILSGFLFSCNNEKKADESSPAGGINISVNNDSTQANVNIGANGINVKTEDGKEANVNIGANGINVKTNTGEEATVQMNGEGMDVKTKEGNTSVKVDKNGNMLIKGPDGKEISVNVKDMGNK